MTNTPKHPGPAFVAWFIPGRERAPWVRIGALWPTKSGKGFTMNLDVIPVAPGSIVIMPNEPKAEGEGA